MTERIDRDGDRIRFERQILDHLALSERQRLEVEKSLWFLLVLRRSRRMRVVEANSAVVRRCRRFLKEPELITAFEAMRKLHGTLGARDFIKALP